MGVRQPSLNNRTINQCRGRMLGGCSSLNFLMMVYPSRANIDAWEAVGNEGWNFAALAPYFRKFARTHAPAEAARAASRMDEHYDPLISAQETGPLRLSFGDGFGPNNAAWMDAFAELGLGPSVDPRSGAARGAFQQAATIDPDTKTRTGAMVSYLTEEVRARPNLTVLVHTQVKKILLEPAGDGSGEFVARGVEVRSREDGSERTFLAGAEVVLAAGALHTPQLLELSGVGGREILEKHGIPVKIDNPNVGESRETKKPRGLG